MCSVRLAHIGFTETSSPWLPNTDGTRRCEHLRDIATQTVSRPTNVTTGDFTTKVDSLLVTCLTEVGEKSLYIIYIPLRSRGSDETISGFFRWCVNGTYWRYNYSLVIS